jgi:hypothetical protein
MSGQDAGKDEDSCNKQGAHTDLPGNQRRALAQMPARKYGTNLGSATRRYNTRGAATIAQSIEFEI